MDATEFMIEFSKNYPAIAMLVKRGMFVVAIFATLYALLAVVRIELFGTLQPTQMGYVKICSMILLAGLAAAMGWTLDFVGNSFYDYGGYVLEAYEGTSEWVVREGSTEHAAMQTFVQVTLKTIGLLFGAWGLLTLILVCLPNTESTVKGGIIRMAVGAALFNPIEFLDFFGGWGTAYLVPGA